MKSKPVVFLILTCLTLSFMLGLVEVAHAVGPTVKLNLHKNPVAVTLGTGLLNTTTTIMNTTASWSATPQTTDIVCAANFTTWYNASVDFFLSPRLAGLLTMSSCTATVYINSTKPTTASLWMHLYKNVAGANFSSYSGTDNTTVTTTASAFTVSMGAGADTLAASNFLFLKISICSINDTDTFSIWYDTAAVSSRVTLVTVDPVAISLVSDRLNYRTDDAPVLTGTVTDVFGGYDIASAPTVLFTFPGLTCTLAADSYGDTQYTNTYTYTLATPAEGTWTPTATVTDKYGNSYTSSTSFQVTAKQGGGNNVGPTFDLTGLGGNMDIVVVGLIVGLGVCVWLAIRSKPKRRRHR